MIGFVNGLAIVIAGAQLGTFRGLAGAALWQQIGLTLLTALLIKTLAHDRLRKVWPKQIPAPLAAIVIVTVLVNVLAPDFFALAKTVGDVAAVAGTLPVLHLPDVPLTFGTLRYGLARFPNPASLFFQTRLILSFIYRKGHSAVRGVRRRGWVNRNPANAAARGRNLRNANVHAPRGHRAGCW